MFIKKSIEIPLYRGEFVVIFADYEVKLIDYFPNNIIEETDKIEYAHYYDVNEEGKQGFMICFNLDNKNRKVYHGTIAHEITHAIHRICDLRDININYDQSEPIAYLTDMVTDFVYGVIKENNIKIETI